MSLSASETQRQTDLGAALSRIAPTLLIGDYLIAVVVVSEVAGAEAVVNLYGCPEGVSFKSTPEFIGICREIASTECCVSPVDAPPKEDLHHSKPEQFDGSPVDTANRVPLHRIHRSLYTTFWRRLSDYLKRDGPQ